MAFPCVQLFHVVAFFSALLYAPTYLQGTESKLPAAFGEWLISSWQTEHGLPQNAVTALHQARSGYLWVGTFNGVARFDGLDFTVFDPQNTPALRGGRTTSIHEDPQGVLWVGQENGDLCTLRGDRWQSERLPAGWPGGTIRAIQSDSSGAVWLLHPTGLVLRVADGYIIPALRPGVYAASVIAPDSDGQLWLLRNQSLARLERGGIAPWTPPADSGRGEILAIAASSHGGLWMVIDREVRHWRSGDWVESRGAIVLGADEIPTAMVELAGGDVVVGTIKTGAQWFSSGQSARTLGRSEGLTHDWIRRLLEDREGNLWVGTAGGLHRLRQRRAAMAPDHWQGAQVRAVSATTSGEIWVGTEGAGLFHLQPESFASDGPVPGPPDSFIWSTLVDRTGRVWAGTWGQGLLERGGDGKFISAVGWPSDVTIVTALYEARDGALWAGSEFGLLRRDPSGNEWRPAHLRGQLGHVRTIAEDAADAIWCGLSGEGLVRLQRGEITAFRKGDGLPSDFVWTIDPEPDGSLWIGTFGGGLCRWSNGRFQTITTAQGLPSNVICHLADLGSEYWISSYGGIFRVAKADLLACAEGRIRSLNCLTLTRSDGLATLECSGGFQPSGARTPDGRLWFPTSKGLAIIDPTRVAPQRLPPTVVIESAQIDDQSKSPRAPLVVSPGRHRVDIRYTGLSLAAPERVRFRHRLTNLDREWVEAAGRRTATYHYLPPGEYVFEVTACNGDGVWSSDPASLAVTIQPQFWQTWWFRIAAVLALSFSLFGAYRLRMQNLREIQRVRFRIARDLHDEVGANLGSIALLSEAIEQQPNPGDMRDLRSIALRTVEMLKEVVWLTNPAHDRLSELVARMRETARQMLPRIEWDFRTENLPDELLLPPAWRHHLLPIFKEALHNSARHSHARRITIVLRIIQRRLELVIEDDGCGFDPAKVIPGDGLLNLQRRARDMDATLNLTSRPGGGTVVQLLVAIP